MAGELYSTFVEQIREISRAHAIEGLLGWDQETYMPKRGAADRGGQMALIAGYAHEKLTADELGTMLDKLANEDFGGDHVATTNLRETRRNYDRAVKIPTKLVKELANATTVAKSVWAEARQDNDFAKFAPHLEKLIDLKRQVAERIGYESEPYDALMDEFEPGAKAAEVQAVFDKLREELVPLVAAISAAPNQPDTSLLTRTCPQSAQAAFGRNVAESMGFDFDAGRIDISTHPFCSGSTPSDVRLTTRYDEHYFPQALFGTMHEAGHGLYEQGLDLEHVDTPMASSTSLGIHESQSRMWENMVGRGRPFWEYYYSAFKDVFPKYHDVAIDDFYFAINTVRPSLIRVEADEVTYGLHIMLRFDIERKMMSGELAVKDIPDAWNSGVENFLGIAVPNDAQGCLQDIHWSMATFGYFPTYALGNLYAAQFFAAAQKAIPDLDDKIAAGELHPLLDWLRENIHRHGMRYRAGELVRIVTGQDLSHEPFMAYLNAKFKPLYGI